MVWVLVLASVLGFLAVESVANQPQIHEVFSNGFENFALLKFGLIGGALCCIFLYIFVKKQQDNLDDSVDFWQMVKTKWLNVTLLICGFFLTLLASVSVGLDDYYQYQKNLLKQQLNITAIVKINQISDTAGQIIKLNNKPTLIGNHNIRHVWQIIDISDFSGDISTDVEKNLVNMQVLTNIDLVRQSEYQSIINQLKPNDTLKVKLALTPIIQPQQAIAQLPKYAKVINLGFDEANWLRQKNVQALASVSEIDKKSLNAANTLNKSNNNGLQNTHFLQKMLLKIEQMRWQFRQKIQNRLHHDLQTLTNQSVDDELTASQEKLHSYAILLGLLTGDRALMTSDIKNTYQQTGISHLLAISGPHVLMLASMVSLWVLWLVQHFLPNLLKRVPSRLLVLWVSVVVAGFYALLVGFELPAQRTFWLLLFTAIASQLLLTQRPIYLLMWVGLLMMWWDTTAVLQAGFWLSFIAVGLLIKFSERVGQQKVVAIFEKSSTWQSELSIWQRIFLRLKQEIWLLFKLQLWLFVLMLPISVWFFGKISLVSILVNLVAVPFLGLVVVPLDMLAGVLSLLPVLGSFADIIWHFLAIVIDIFHHGLQFLLKNNLAKQVFIYFSQSQLILFCLLAIVLVSRGILPKTLALPILLSIVLLNFQNNTINDKLIVLNNARFTTQLFLSNQQSWLIIADNQVKFDNKKSKDNNQAEMPIMLSQSDSIHYVLNQDIYPILAKYHVKKLTGIISQTPTETTNQLTQALASNVPVLHYYLAGFDAVKPLKNEQNQPFGYSVISPKACQHPAVLQSDNGFVMTALTGWHLNLSDEQISQNERNILQNCFIKLDIPTDNVAKQVILTTGNSPLPMQMLVKMYDKSCLAADVEMIVAPYSLPLDEDWLVAGSPKHLHVVTGQYANQTFSEKNQFNLLNLAKKPTLIQSHVVGAVEYSFN